MPGSLSTQVLKSCAFLHLGAIASHGFSDEARAMRESQVEVARALEQSVALFGPKARAISTLAEVAAECSVENWDGNDAAPVSLDAIDFAASLIRALPAGVPMPEIAVDPDGAVSLDWIHSKSRLISISVNTSPRLAFAWLDGLDKGHGVVHFDGKALPDRLKNALLEIVDADSSIRTA